MMRLTRRKEKYNTMVGDRYEPISTTREINNKLGELEDLLQSYNVKDLKELDKLLEMATTYEELSKQLGCPLEVVFRAIKNGIWFTNEDNELEYIDEALCFNTKKDSGKFVFDNYGYYCKNIEKIKCNEIYLEDYKKTWWLKKDKSE